MIYYPVESVSEVLRTIGATQPPTTYAYTAGLPMWHPTSKSEPTEDGVYLVTLHYGQVWVAEFRHGEWEMLDNGTLIEGDVIAWQPMPAPFTQNA